MLRVWPQDHKDFMKWLSRGASAASEQSHEQLRQKQRRPHTCRLFAADFAGRKSMEIPSQVCFPLHHPCGFFCAFWVKSLGFSLFTSLFFLMRFWFPPCCSPPHFSVCFLQIVASFFGGDNQQLLQVGALRLLIERISRFVCIFSLSFFSCAQQR